MFVARDAEGSESEIPMHETVAKLKRTLPKDHPLIGAVEDCFSQAREVIEDYMGEEAAEQRPDAYPALDALVTRLDDWRAGIRDWDEVEPELDEARRVADWV